MKRIPLWNDFLLVSPLLSRDTEHSEPKLILQKAIQLLQNYYYSTAVSNQQLLYMK